MVKDIKIIHYDYILPDERIPRHPLRQRDACRMIISESDGKIRHAHFSDLPAELAGSAPLLVCNDTRVINARISFRKPTGGVIEVFLLEPVDPHDYVLMFQAKRECRWKCMVGNAKRWKDSPLEMQLDIDGESVILTALKTGVVDGNTREIIFRWNSSHPFSVILEKAGFIPIPPYLKRDAEEIDRDDYQTVFSRFKGSVAAPTAGLHFTDALLERLRGEGVDVAHVTLHVGAGTFLPVKSECIGEHPMHTEVFSVSRRLILDILDAIDRGREILAVGTTTVRTLESLPYLGRAVSKNEPLMVSQWEAYDNETNSFDTVEALKAILAFMDLHKTDSITAATSIMIAPGFRWRIVDRLITNFHQPQSTLLLLVDSFLGGGNQWRKIYDEALMGGYRFLSYGDACLLSPGSDDRFPVLPGSKSLAARLLTASLTVGEEPLILNLPDCDDTRQLRDAVSSIRNSREPVTINIGNGGTTFRFLLAVLASIPGRDVTLIPGAQLSKRPKQPLIDALNALGADITVDKTDDSYSYHIKGKQLAGGKITLDTSVSSQFVSALMLAAPLWTSGASIKLQGEKVSFPYIEMTIAILNRLGIDVGINDEHDLITILPGQYRFCEPVMAEPDWSAAGYFFAEEFLRGIESSTRPDFDKLRQRFGLLPHNVSLQGDSVIEECFGRLYELEDGQQLELDCTGFPDAVPPLVVAAVAAGKSFRFRGLSHLRHKESDRLQSLAEELSKLGYTISIGNDGSISHTPVTTPAFVPERNVHIDPHGDHRIAMAFAPLVSRFGVIIDNPDVVNKSFAGFNEVFPHPHLPSKPISDEPA